MWGRAKQTYCTYTNEHISSVYSLHCDMGSDVLSNVQLTGVNTVHG